MPGPNSAPNGDRSLVVDHEKRRKLQESGKLITGKTKKASK